MDFESNLCVTLVIISDGILRGNFTVDYKITIHQLKNDLLDRLGPPSVVDYMLGTLQGSLYDSNRLSEC